VYGEWFNIVDNAVVTFSLPLCFKTGQGDGIVDVPWIFVCSRHENYPNLY